MSYKYADLNADLVHVIAFKLSELPLRQWQALPKTEVRKYQVQSCKVLTAERDFLAKKEREAAR